MTYQVQFEPGDTIIYEGAFYTITGVRCKSNEWQYEFGNDNWHSAPLVDGEAMKYEEFKSNQPDDLI